MNETTKTVLFVGTMVVLCSAAYFSQPRVAAVDFEAELGEEFFPDFEDPLVAARLAIVEYDETSASLHRFEVAKIDGVWSIPSHEGYPTDAERQLAQAAASLIDVAKLGVASTSREDHETFGVVDPDSAPAGAEGIGKKVTLSGENDAALAEFIVGKAVKGEEGLRYVRVPGQEVVFRVKVDTSKLSTKFEDWIEEDLLELDAFDIRKITLNNYSIDELNNRIVEGDVLELTYTDAEWQLEGLGEDEELVTSQLNELRTALDDLKIVDVRRKPAGLSSGLRTEEGLELGIEERLSLQSRGYFVVRGQLLSNEGEVVCTTQDGVVYVLRFGEIAAGTGGGSSGGEEEDKEEEQESTGSNRYIFVTAQFDESMIPKPELEPLPDLKGADEDAKSQGEKTAEPADEDAKSQGEKTAEPADEDARSEGEKTAEPADEDARNEGEETAEPADEDARSEGEEPAEPTEAQAKQPGDEGERAEGAPVEGQGADEKADQEEDKEAERKRIEEENRRKTEEYNEKIEKAKATVKELNDRFADWYYVISDEVYRKIHLSRDEIVNKKEPVDEKGPDAQPDDASPPPPSAEDPPSAELPDNDD